MQGSPHDFGFDIRVNMGRTSTTADLHQGELFRQDRSFAEASSEQATKQNARMRRTFVEPGPNNLMIGSVRLKAYLEQCGERGALAIKRSLEDLRLAGLRSEIRRARAGALRAACRLNDDLCPA